MALLETSLSASYQTSWRPRDALREIIANAIDAQERDGHGMDMTFKGRQAHGRVDGREGAYIGSADGRQPVEGIRQRHR